MTLILGLAMLAAPSLLCAKNDNMLGIFPVTPTPALAASVKQKDKSNEMDQVLQNLDSYLQNRIQNTDKFKLVERGELKVVLTEQAFANSGNVDAADKNAAQQFKVAGANRMLGTKITGFMEFHGPIHIENEPKPAFKRTLSLSAVATIYGSTTAVIIGSVESTVETNLFLANPDMAEQSAALSDKLLVDVADKVAEEIASKFVLKVLPAKVADVDGEQVTLNWGEGMFIKPGDQADVFETRLTTDPDDPDKNITVETRVGKIEITNVTATQSTAKITETVAGKKVATLNIVRFSKSFK